MTGPTAYDTVALAGFAAGSALSGAAAFGVGLTTGPAAVGWMVVGAGGLICLVLAMIALLADG